MQTQREDDVKTQGECYLQVKECLRRPETRKDAGNRCSHRPSEGTIPDDTWIFWPSSLQKYELARFSCLGNPVGGSLLGQLPES